MCVRRSWECCVFGPTPLTIEEATGADSETGFKDDADFEARSYYYGLPSCPVLVYRTGTPWKKPTSWRIPKEIRPVFDHPIADVWDELGPQVPDYLDSVNVAWTTIDVVRFADVNEDPGPAVLWIGVKPGSLSRKNAEVAAVGCEGLLVKFNITNVEIAFRESLFTRLVQPELLERPKLLDYGLCSSETIDSVSGPLTPALGLKIATRATPHAEGTGAIYVRLVSEDHDASSEKVYILTARHVIFPPNAEYNEPYNCMQTHKPRLEVILPGPNAFQTVLRSIMVKIGESKWMVDHYNRQLNNLQKREACEDLDSLADEKTVAEKKLKVEEASIKTLNHFHDKVTKYWSEESQRIIGHVVYSPPITVGTGTKHYTEDWALIELDHNKIDWDNFEGNVIDLGVISPSSDVTKMLSATTRVSKYVTLAHHFPLQGVIEEDKLCHPQTFDANGEPCLTVIKNGCTTGITVGHATGIKSFVREYFPNRTHRTTMEWAILSYNKKYGVFSAPGDSGAIIVDEKGCIGGLLTGGAGKGDSVDITYATPYYWLWEHILTHFPNAHIY